MKKIFLLFILLLIIKVNSQTLQYAIITNSSSIGTLSVTKKESKDIIQIEAVSHVKVKLFITIDLSYKLNCTYKNDELIFSAVTTYVNGKIHSTTTTEKNEDYYTITKEGHLSKYIDIIHYSGSLLYFKKPKNEQFVFSEFNAIKNPIKKIDSNNYQITNSINGHLSEYKYKNGLLESTTIHHTLLTFTLKKIK